MGRRSLYATVLLAVLALGVSGCSGDPQPKFADPTTDPPTSTSVEPVSDPPTSTPTAEPKPESAQAFIRRWHQVSDAMQVTGETEEYLALGPECPTCADTASIIDGYYAAGGFIRFDGTKVRSIKRVGRVGDNVEFDVALDTAPTRYKEKARGPLRMFPGGQNSIRIRLESSDKTWLVLDYSVLAS